VLQYINSFKDNSQEKLPKNKQFLLTDIAQDEKKQKKG